MTKHHDLFARRNQARITTLVVLAIFNLDIFPSSGDELKVFAIGIGVIVVLSSVRGHKPLEALRCVDALFDYVEDDVFRGAHGVHSPHDLTDR
jgi:hypothetical protein